MRTHAGWIALGMAVGPWGASEAQERGSKVSAQEYEGWRQYSVHCARCHGQDVVGNPVAANLLLAVKDGGPMAGKEAFTTLVAEGRVAKGMPAFKETASAEQIGAMYAYVKGRADGLIAAGRPAEPRK